jgi:hypothetical protein
MTILRKITVECSKLPRGFVGILKHGRQKEQKRWRIIRPSGNVALFNADRHQTQWMVPYYCGLFINEEQPFFQPFFRGFYAPFYLAHIKDIVPRHSIPSVRRF